MRKLDAVLLKTFLWGLPVAVADAVFLSLRHFKVIDQAAPVTALLYDLSGLFIALWMALVLYLALRLVVSADLREQVLVRLTFIRERDEREAMLVGQATKTTFLLTLAVLLFLFCLSSFQVSIYRVAQEQAVNGKTGMVSLGFNFQILDTQAKTADAVVKQKDIFSYTRLPISNTALILFLIIWQIAVFNLVMRRLVRF